MKICLLGEFSGNLDEGMRKVSFHFAEEFKKKQHQVLTLDLRDVFTKAFWKDIKNFNPDIIHYIHGPSIKSFILLKVISLYSRDAKTVMSAMHPSFSFLSRQFISVFKPDLILTQSHETEEMFKKRGCKTEFMPCGVDVKKFTPVTVKVKEELREKYGVEKQKFVILHVGSIKRGRNVLLLKELQEKDGTNQVVIVGATSTGIEKEILHQLEKAGCIVWKEYFEEKEIQEIYALSDCYVFPATNVLSAIEIPLSVLEAMSCNLPVISTRFGGLDRAFEEGDGLIFADKDEDFMQGIEKIKRGGMEIRTREKVLPYSWENIAKRLEETYERLL